MNEDPGDRLGDVDLPGKARDNASVRRIDDRPPVLPDGRIHTISRNLIPRLRKAKAAGRKNAVQVCKPNSVCSPPAGGEEAAISLGLGLLLGSSDLPESVAP